MKEGKKVYVVGEAHLAGLAVSKLMSIGQDAVVVDSLSDLLKQQNDMELKSGQFMIEEFPFPSPPKKKTKPCKRHQYINNVCHCGQTL